MKFNILVTGGAGYIGSVAILKLLENGHKVHVIDNFMHNQSSLNHYCLNKNFQVNKGDIRSKEIISPLLKKADLIIPLAALVGAPICKQDPIGATTTNFDAMVMILKEISKNQIIIMPTTNSGYGKGDKNKYCDEKSELRPISLYAKQKVEIEKRLMEHPSAISLRLATVFGMSPCMRVDLLVNDFVFRAVRDRFIVLFESNFHRNFIHIQDVVNAFIFSINNFDLMKGEIYNIGLSDANLTKKELCEKIKKFIDDFIFFDGTDIKDPDQRDYLVSNKKIEKIGFHPLISLEDGIQELIKGYRMLRNNPYL